MPRVLDVEDLIKVLESAKRKGKTLTDKQQSLLQALYNSMPKADDAHPVNGREVTEEPMNFHNNVNNSPPPTPSLTRYAAQIPVKGGRKSRRNKRKNHRTKNKRRSS